MYGTGDYEDSPEIADDKEMRCYVVYDSDMFDNHVINASAGQYESYEDAVEAVEADKGFQEWLSVVER